MLTPISNADIRKANASAARFARSARGFAVFLRQMMEILKFVAHSKKVISIATELGWHPGARYTNLRDVKTFAFRDSGFLDINWKNYCYEKHVDAAAETTPLLTIARDVECIFSLEKILKEAETLLKYSRHVALVPKDALMNDRLQELIPKEFLLAYSVPTKYGGTQVSIESFDRPVHLLGGRPDTQRKLADKLKVFSIDCNRFTLDARYGDYFDGFKFLRHPTGGYERCLIDSIENINKIWSGYIIHDDVRNFMEVGRGQRRLAT